MPFYGCQNSPMIWCWLIDWWHHTGIAQKQEKRPSSNTQKSRTTYRQHGKHFLRHNTPVSVQNQPYSSTWHQRYLTKSSGRSESTSHHRQCALRGATHPSMTAINTGHSVPKCHVYTPSSIEVVQTVKTPSLSFILMAVSPQKSLTTHILKHTSS